MPTDKSAVAERLNADQYPGIIVIHPDLVLIDK